jgi:MarR family transcriptional regulator, transcriptional regulator for hemolysin
VAKSAEQLRIFTGDLVIAARLWRKLARDIATQHGVAEAGASPLLWLGRKGAMRQRVLAEYCGMEGPSLVRLLDDLNAAGLISRAPDATDGRANVISLTAAGEERVIKIEADLKALRSKTFEGLSDADIAAALKVLDAISRAAGRIGEEA